MNAYKNIVDFLLAGAMRIHPAERTEAVCSLFAGMLVEMLPREIAEFRREVERHRDVLPELVESVVDLIDGHLALREIFSDAVDEPSKSADWPGFDR